MGHLRRFGRAGGKEGREVGARFGYIANLYLATMENNFNGRKLFFLRCEVFSSRIITTYSAEYSRKSGGIIRLNL